MLHFVRRRLFFGCVLGFIALFAAGALAKGAEGKSRIKTARKECRTIIAEGLDSENARVRVAAVRAVGEFLGGTHKFDGDRPEEILKRALGDSSLQVAYAAARFLPDTDRGKKVIERYVQHLADEGDVLSRLERIRLLELDEELKYVKKKALSAEDTKVRAEAIRTLGVLGGAEAISTVMQTYSEKDPAIQVASRNALWKLQFRGEVVEVYEFADSKKPHVGYQCGLGLRSRLKADNRTGRYNEERCFFLYDALLQILDSQNRDTRVIAGRAIGDAIWVSNLIRPLWKHLKNETDRIAKVACAGGLLKQLYGPKAQLVNDSRYDVLPLLGWNKSSFRLYSEAAEIADRRGDTGVAAGHLLVAFGQSEDDVVKSVLSQAGHKRKNVRKAGYILLGGEGLRRKRKHTLAGLKKNFDPRTMDPRDLTPFGRKFVYLHNARGHTMFLKKEFFKRIDREFFKRSQKKGTAQPITIAIMWDSLWEGMQDAEDEQVRGIYIWLDKVRQNPKQ